jgi:hypothetical protein
VRSLSRLCLRASYGTFRHAAVLCRCAASYLFNPKLLPPGMRNYAMTCGDAGPGRSRSGYKKPLVLQPYHLQPSCGVFVYIRRSILGSFPSSKAICSRHADVTLV